MIEIVKYMGGGGRRGGVGVVRRPFKFVICFRFKIIINQNLMLYNIVNQGFYLYLFIRLPVYVYTYLCEGLPLRTVVLLVSIKCPPREHVMPAFRFRVHVYRSRDAAT